MQCEDCCVYGLEELSVNQSNEPSAEFELTANSLEALIETHELAVSSNSSLASLL